MKKILKSITVVFLSIMILSTATSLSATSTDVQTISDAQHKQIMLGYLARIKELQTRVSDVAQAIITNPDGNTPSLNNRLKLINNESIKIFKDLEDYQRTVSGYNARIRDVFLMFNIINSIDSSLYSLSLLSPDQSDLERLELLDEFFRLRINAIDTMTIFENILL